MTILHHQSYAVNTLEEIVSGCCNECGETLTVAYFHVGGYPNNQPFAVCSNPDGGEAHVRVRISDSLAEQYSDFVKAMDKLDALLDNVMTSKVSGRPMLFGQYAGDGAEQ